MPNPRIFPHHEEWNFSLPSHTRWSMLLRWIDRYETMTYRLEEDQLKLWLPAEVGEGFLSISPKGETALDLQLAHDGNLHQSEVEEFLGKWWDLERDMGPFYATFKDDPLLKASIEQNHGARIVGFPDLFEALVIGILGQQVNVAFAYTLKQRLTEAYGQSGDWDGQTWWRFPRPQNLIGVEIRTLREMQISQRKAEYLQGVAQAMADGQFTKESLETQPFEEQMATLTALRGIGPWTAQYVCMKCLHSLRAFPAGDAGLQNNAKRLLAMDRKPTIGELQELAKSWSGWEAYATWFLWMA